MSRRRTMAIVCLTTIAVLGQAAAAAPALAQEQLPPLDDWSLAPGHDGLGSRR